MQTTLTLSRPLRLLRKGNNSDSLRPTAMSKTLCFSRLQNVVAKPTFLVNLCSSIPRNLGHNLLLRCLTFKSTIWWKNRSTLAMLMPLSRAISRLVCPRLLVLKTLFFKGSVDRFHFLTPLMRVLKYRPHFLQWNLLQRTWRVTGFPNCGILFIFLQKLALILLWVLPQSGHRVSWLYVTSRWVGLTESFFFDWKADSTS